MHIKSYVLEDKRPVNLRLKHSFLLFKIIYKFYNDELMMLKWLSDGAV